MIHDEELRSSVDYSEGQKQAAHRVLVELVNLFNEYRDDIRIVGGGSGSDVSGTGSRGKC